MLEGLATAGVCFNSCVITPAFSSSSEVVHSVSADTISSLSGNPVITTEKLSSKKYLSWSSSVKMWFRCHGVSDRLSKHLSDILEADRNIWDRVDAQLVNLLWQSALRWIWFHCFMSMRIVQTFALMLSACILMI